MESKSLHIAMLTLIHVGAVSISYAVCKATPSIALLIASITIGLWSGRLSAWLFRRRRYRLMRRASDAETAEWRRGYAERRAAMIELKLAMKDAAIGSPRKLVN